MDELLILSVLKQKHIVTKPQVSTTLKQRHTFMTDARTSAAVIYCVIAVNITPVQRPHICLNHSFNLSSQKDVHQLRDKILYMSKSQLLSWVLNFLKSLSSSSKFKFQLTIMCALQALMTSGSGQVCVPLLFGGNDRDCDLGPPGKAPQYPPTLHFRVMKNLSEIMFSQAETAPPAATCTSFMRRICSNNTWIQRTPRDYWRVITKLQIKVILIHLNVLCVVQYLSPFTFISVFLRFSCENESRWRALVRLF